MFEVQYTTFYVCTYICANKPRYQTVIITSKCIINSNICNPCGLLLLSEKLKKKNTYILGCVFEYSERLFSLLKKVVRLNKMVTNQNYCPLSFMIFISSVAPIYKSNHQINSSTIYTLEYVFPKTSGLDSSNWICAGRNCPHSSNSNSSHSF